MIHDPENVWEFWACPHCCEGHKCSSEQLTHPLGQRFPNEEKLELPKTLSGSVWLSQSLENGNGDLAFPVPGKWEWWFGFPNPWETGMGLVIWLSQSLSEAP